MGFGRYPFVWIAGAVSQFLGLVVWVFTALGVFVLLTYGPNYIPAPGTWLNDVVGEIASTLIQLGIVALIIRGALTGLALLASGQLLWLLLDWAEDTRLLRMHRDREMIDQARGGQG